MSQRAPPPLTSDAALFLDFDGTLVELAPTPSQIEVAGMLPPLLHRTMAMLDGALAIVTGRSIKAIDEHLPTEAVAIAGLHGAEIRDRSGRTTRAQIDAPALQTARTLLADFNGRHPEVLLEDKGLSLALHFRQAPHLRETCEAIIDLCVVKSMGQLERLDGAYVTEVKQINVSKARAIEALMRDSPFHGRQPIFAGDDITDDTGFAYVAAHSGFGIIVGDRPSPVAIWRLPTVSALHLWLQAFVTQ